MAKKATKKTAKPAAKAAKTFSAEERSAIRERAKEMKAAGGDGESETLAKIAAMMPADRAMAERIHAIIKAMAPQLSSRTWYGMPAYAKDGKVVCFFQPAQKFKTRYSTLGFNDKAALDDGRMWPVAYALTELTPADEARIGELVKRAAG
jgi:uncharacterized protein YdhG (YjbR/CyaY superfamily)